MCVAQRTALTGPPLYPTFDSKNQVKKEIIRATVQSAVGGGLGIEYHPLNPSEGVALPPSRKRA